MIALPLSASGQLSGTKTINPSGSGSNNYTTISAAINALNISGVGSGGVTFLVSAGVVFHENPPALTATGTVANPIIFQKSGGGANPVVTPLVMGKRNGTQFGNGDAILQITGGDEITFDGIDAVDDTSTFYNHGRYEYGYLLRKASADDACKQVTIRNCTVVLAKSNRYATGIMVSNMLPTGSATSSTDTTATGVTVTSVGGRHENIRIYGVTITNALVGIGVRGYNQASTFNFYDHEVQIGVDGANTITGFGYGSTTGAYGIYAAYQDSMRVEHNSIDGGQGCTTNCYGIALLASQSACAWVQNNAVTLTSSGTTSSLVGISSNFSNTGSALFVFGNRVHDCNYATATAGVFYGICNLGAPDYLLIDSNQVVDNTLAGTGSMYPVYGGGSSGITTLLIARNVVTGNVKTLTDGALYCIYAASEIVRVTANTISNNGHATGSGYLYGYYNVGGPSSESVDSNRISGMTGAPIYGIYSLTIVRGIKTFRNDTMWNFVGGGIIRGIFESNDSTCTVTQCLFADFHASTGSCTAVEVTGGRSTIGSNVITNFENTSTGSNLVCGLDLNSTTSTTVTNNMISDLRAPASSYNYGPSLTAIDVGGGGTATLCYNSVYLDAVSASATAFSTIGLAVSTSPRTLLANNCIVNVSAPGPGSGTTVAYRRSSATLTSYDSTSNNNLLYAGTPAGNRLIFSDGTNADQTLAGFIARVAPRDTVSISEAVPFANTVSAPYDLHLRGNAVTRCESGGKTVAASVVDIDGAPRQGSTGYSGAGSAPDIGADEGEFTRVDLFAPDIAFTPMQPGIVATARNFSGVAISDISGVDGASGTRPRVYYKKSTHINAYNDNSSASNGWKWTEATGAVSPFTFVIDYAKLFGGAGVSLGDVIQYFVVAQDSATPVHVGIRSGSFASPPASVALGSAAFPIGDTIREFTISNSISGSFTIPRDYRSLTGAGGLFEDVNQKTLTASIVVTIADSVFEDGSNALAQFSQSPSNAGYSISIRPDTARERTLYGATSGVALLRLDGADRVTFDGRYAGAGRYLRIVNNATDAPVLSLFHDACGNTVQHCRIEGGCAVDSVGLLFLGDGISTGNDSNVVEGNLIGQRRWGGADAATLVCSRGAVASASNSANAIDSNALVDFAKYGVLIAQGGNGDGWRIDGNACYRARGVATPSDLVALALLGGGNAHRVRGNSIGGADSARGGAPLASSQTITAIALAVGGAPLFPPTSVQQNRISNIHSMGAADCALLSVASGNVDIGGSSGNIIGGGIVASDTIRAGGNLRLCTVASADTVRIAHTILSAAVSGQGSIAGIVVDSCLPGSRVEGNRIFGLRSELLATGSGAPWIDGVRVLGGTALYANNQVTLGDTLPGDARIRGIHDASNGANRFLYNTVVIKGQAASTASNGTSAFLKSSAGSPMLRNNALINARSNATGGTGAHVAIAADVATGWVGNANPALVASNYNLLAAVDSMAVGAWMSASLDAASWKSTVTNNDVFSLSAVVSSPSSLWRLSPAELFPGLGTGDLRVDSTRVVCCFLNGAAVAGTESDTLGSDYLGPNRRAKSNGFASDIGSMEFTPAVAPPRLEMEGTLAASHLTSFSFAGRTLATLRWGAAGTLPDSVFVSYHPGVDPPSAAQGLYSNAYWSVDAFGGSGYQCDVTLCYTPAILGTIASEGNTRMAERSGAQWTHFPSSILDVTQKTVSCPGLGSVSDFALSDDVHPLPVELTSFTAAWKGSEVRLAWKTASELNSLRFAIERRVSFRDSWTEIGDVTARGSVDVPTLYNFTDAKLPQASELFYRLRKIDRDGSFSYSNIVRVSQGKVDGFTVFGTYPNPFNPGTTISFAIPSEQHVTVRVFDITGRLIETVMDETLAAGSHAATFFAKDLPSGMYRFVITAGTQMKSGTMILTR